MISYPHPTLPGVWVTSPIYIGSDMEKFLHCQHQWPEGLPDMQEIKGENTIAGMQVCPLCGGTRAIYKKEVNG